MANLINDIATYLQTAGVGTVGTDIFCAYMPDTVDTGVVVLDTGGVMPDPDLPTKRPTLQIFIRAADYETGKTKLDLVRSTLHRLSGTTVGSTFIMYCLAQSEGGHIGRNERGLDEFSMNFICLTQWYD
jgi:hypothetical protein